MSKEPYELLAGREFHIARSDDNSVYICLNLCLVDDGYMVIVGNTTHCYNMKLDDSERRNVDKMHQKKADAFNFVRKFDDFFTAMVTYKTVYSTLQAVFQCAGRKLGEYNKMKRIYERLNEVGQDEISKATYQTINRNQFIATCAECEERQKKQCSYYKSNDMCEGECKSCYERRDCFSECNECEDVISPK